MKAVANTHYTHLSEQDLAPSRLVTILRWIVLLPAAITGGLLAGTLSKILNRLSLHYWVGVDADWWLASLYTETMASGLTVATFVYVGAFA